MFIQVFNRVTKNLSVVFFVLFSLTLWACSQNESSVTKKVSMKLPKIEASEFYPGGEGTVSLQPFPSFMKPVSNLSSENLPQFHAGKALANQPWVKAPTITTARDGLGPLYNARTCLSCHINGGRGQMPVDSSKALFSAILRLSLPGRDSVVGVVPELMYGEQLQTQSIALSHQLRSNVSAGQLGYKEVSPEAYVYVNWEKKEFTYPDGVEIALRFPQLMIKNLGYGELHADTLISLRVAPPLHGLGLLESIKQSDIDAKLDPEDRNHDGISGKMNYVWDFDLKKTVPGRFGLKANRANMRMQTAAAFSEDLGISNSVFPYQLCTHAQALCQAAPSGNDKQENGSPEVEISDALLNLVIEFNLNLGVPERRNQEKAAVISGRSLFYQAGCDSCHTPKYTTADSTGLKHLSNQVIWPYTDLLLHDMGPELADGRSDYLATGSEWRTPPLWGVGLGKQVNGSDNLLHDGRAQSVEAAIIWHGGEAESAKNYFIHLNQTQRQSLVAFVESL